MYCSNMTNNIAERAPSDHTTVKCDLQCTYTTVLGLWADMLCGGGEDIDKRTVEGLLFVFVL